MMTFKESVTVLSIVGAVCTFAWGVVQFFQNQKQQGETRRIEATKPFLERQLLLYTEATQLASTIATTSNAKKKELSRERFWSLYWGELALVEDSHVEAAMVNLGNALTKQSPDEGQITTRARSCPCLSQLTRSILGRSGLAESALVEGGLRILVTCEFIDKTTGARQPYATRAGVIADLLNFHRSR